MTDTKMIEKLKQRTEGPSQRRSSEIGNSSQRRSREIDNSSQRRKIGTAKPSQRRISGSERNGTVPEKRNESSF